MIAKYLPIKFKNEAVVELISYYSKPVYQGDLGDMETLVRRFLNKTGIESRFWRAPKEKPIDIIISCFENAIKMAGVKRQEIDLLLYAGIDRGFLEPANSNFICKALGLESTRSFDIVDACMGWASAVQTADSYIDSSQNVDTVVIVNAEFPMDENGSVLPNNFTVHNRSELDWKSPSYTLGEGASVCIFQKDENAKCLYEFMELSEYAELCMIPLPNAEKMKNDLQDVTGLRELQFYALGAELLSNGLQSAIDVLQQLLGKLSYQPKLIFPHSVSDKAIFAAFQNGHIQSKAYTTVRHLGNLATVSVPSSIKKALLQGVLTSGDKAVAWIASAGMKFSAFEIQL